MMPSLLCLPHELFSTWIRGSVQDGCKAVAACGKPVEMEDRQVRLQPSLRVRLQQALAGHLLIIRTDVSAGAYARLHRGHQA
jgi:hypothetical protein